LIKGKEIRSVFTVSNVPNDPGNRMVAPQRMVRKPGTFGGYTNARRAGCSVAGSRAAGGRMRQGYA
jgi:hypothetical protein